MIQSHREETSLPPPSFPIVSRTIATVAVAVGKNNDAERNNNPGDLVVLCDFSEDNEENKEKEEENEEVSGKMKESGGKTGQRCRNCELNRRK